MGYVSFRLLKRIKQWIIIYIYNAPMLPNDLQMENGEGVILEPGAQLGKNNP
jgi:hypothetical protein